jgi:hypothetical protein
VLVVLVDENFDAYEIHEADRDPVIAAIVAPGSKFGMCAGRSR